MIRERNGRWQVIVQGLRHPITERRQQLTATAASRAEAEAIEAAFVAQVDEARLAHGAGLPTVAEVVAAWWASGPRLAPTTRANYRLNLARHILPALGHQRIDHIRPRLVETFLASLGHPPAGASLAERRNYSQLNPATVRKVRTILSAVMAYAVRLEYVTANPVMKIPPPPLDDTTRVAPTIEEAAQLLIQAAAVDPEFACYLWVAADAGSRRGEALGLHWHNVDLAAGTISIEGVVSAGDDGVRVRPRTKTNRPRTVALSSVTVAHLAEHRDRVAKRNAEAGRPFPERGLVFSGGQGSRRNVHDGLPWRPDSTSRRFKQIKDRAGVNPAIDLHGLRHTMITELLILGVDPRTVMGRAGHSQEGTTMEVYAALRPAADAAAAEAYGALLAAKITELQEKALLAGQDA